MRCSSPRTDGQEGSSAIEVLVLGVLLLVPLVYLVLTVAALQGAAFAAEGAARQAARALVLARDDGAGRASASAAVEAGLADWRIPRGATAVTVVCSPDPGDCVTPRGTVTVGVRISVALPLLPQALSLDAPGAVPVAASAVQRVSMFAAAR
jgi:hypothetical protein